MYLYQIKVECTTLLPNNRRISRYGNLYKQASDCKLLSLVECDSKLFSLDQCNSKHFSQMFQEKNKNY